MFYLTNNSLSVFIPLGIIGVFRWYWYFIKVLGYLLYRPIKPLTAVERKQYESWRDVTVVIPTIDTDPILVDTLESLVKCKPKRIIIVTIKTATAAIKHHVRQLKNRMDVIIDLATVSQANKREQMALGARLTDTSLIVFCDDDVVWPEHMLEWMTAPFEKDSQMGGVGTSQRVVPSSRNKMTIWEMLAGYRLSLRNIEIAATTFIDGGVCCLSGRTAMYKTEIVKDPVFQREFCNEYWRGKYYQHSGDDKFLTRWIHFNNWNSYIQCHRECELGSTFKDDWRFLKQIIRWTRNTWRSDTKSMIYERRIWMRHPFVAFTMVDKCFNPFTLLVGPALVLYLTISGANGLRWWVTLLSYCAWLLFTRSIKYLPHFLRRPQDIVAVPAWVAFNIVFAFMKIYCLFTLHISDWGTRTGADQDVVEGPVEISYPILASDDVDMAMFDPYRMDENTLRRNTNAAIELSVNGNTTITNTGSLKHTTDGSHKSELSSASILKPISSHGGESQLTHSGPTMQGEGLIDIRRRQRQSSSASGSQVMRRNTDESIARKASGSNDNSNNVNMEERILVNGTDQVTGANITGPGSSADDIDSVRTLTMNEIPLDSTTIEELSKTRIDITMGELVRKATDKMAARSSAEKVNALQSSVPAEPNMKVSPVAAADAGLQGF